MTVVEKGFNYMLRNVTRGRQTIKFHKTGVINDSEQVGTSSLEVMKMMQDKIEHDKEQFDNTELNVLRTNIKNIITILSNNTNNTDGNF